MGGKKARRRSILLIAMLVQLLCGMSLSGGMDFTAGLGKVGNGGIDSMMGYGFGLGRRLALGRHVDLRIGASFAAKGMLESLIFHVDSQIYEEGWDIIYRGAIRCNYLQVPVIIELFPSAHNRGIHSLVGVYAARLLRATLHWQEDLSPDPKNITGDLTDIKRNDLGMIVGFGYRSKAGKRWRTDLDLRLEIGLLDVAGEKFSPLPGGKEVRNFALSLTLGLEQ